MAYNKKTWLARLGQGLNKFIINGGSKVTLDSSPDLVTQQGTPLSAENMNDLEQRIADEFSSLSSAYTMNKWQVGSIDTTNGSDYAYTGAIRYPYKVGIGTGVERLSCDLGYYFLLYAWDLNDNYIGAWKTDGTWSKTASGWKSLQDWDCHNYPNYVFKPVLIKDGIATTDYTHFRFTGLNGSQMCSVMQSLGNNGIILGDRIPITNIPIDVAGFVRVDFTPAPSTKDGKQLMGYLIGNSSSYRYFGIGTASDSFYVYVYSPLPSGTTTTIAIRPYYI